MLIVIKLFAEDQSELDSPELDSPMSSSSELEEEPEESQSDDESQWGPETRRESWDFPLSHSARASYEGHSVGDNALVLWSLHVARVSWQKWQCGSRASAVLLEVYSPSLRPPTGILGRWCLLAGRLDGGWL